MAALIPAIIDFIVDRMKRRRGGGGGAAPAAPAPQKDPTEAYVKMFSDYLAKSAIYNMDNPDRGADEAAPGKGPAVAKPMGFPEIHPGSLRPTRQPQK